MLECGISRLVLLVENATKNSHLCLPEKTVRQAAVNTQVHDNFIVVSTTNAAETASYLATITRHLQAVHAQHTLVECARQNLEEVCLLV